ncbi:hypothetical protein BCR34DRAFT_493817 [Clohesyomyces aquaticus]|uniref:EDC4-like protein pdc1 beta-propeller domain-containing protein n=1 Tax=Clohesyomyces aquaticus TaxID=1231657 RepID=A0A1Y1YUH9_9PLEO|nr:hypothetical protein BCR34DRAFT_493817 [Clohesyomyces aquaticus]
MADLQELFARLNGQQSAASQSASAGNQASTYNHPTVSSPIYTPSPSGPHPHHQSAVMSPNTSVANTPAPEHGAVAVRPQTQQQQSTNLLNLLRFNQQPADGNARPEPLPSLVDKFSAQNPSGSWMSPPNPAAAHPRAPYPSALDSAYPARLQASAQSSENPQDLLLRLLNQPKPSQTDNPSTRHSSTSFTPAAATSPETALAEPTHSNEGDVEKVFPDGEVKPAMHIFGTDGAGQSSRVEPESTPKPPKFTYVNPFDKLEAASPRNRTPAPETSRSPAPKMEILKPKHARDGSSTTSIDSKGQPSHKARKLSPSASSQHGTVSEAVSGLGEQVGKQVGEALAEAENESEAQAAKEELASMSPEEVREVEEAIVETAIEIQKELQDKSNVEALEATVPKPMADALRDVVNTVAQADVADSWESAEAEDSSAKDEEQKVIVYRFPMKAFSSITVEGMPQHRISFRTESIMDIARLKKEFDQIDRSLVSATKNFIVYANVKNGGFRIIKQDNGDYRQVFQNHHERIFNIALCASGEEVVDPVESILGIGVNGTVFWTSLEAAREDQFGDDLDTRGLIIPPSPSQDDNTSGGQLKTRAKPSSRHPEFFAVGRGKSIHIVWPKVAAEYVRGKSRICHTEKYLKERSLKILTGKAGKDFTFSEDDTVIVSLDKAGRMRFWDIRPLTHPDMGIPAQPATAEVKDTLLEFHTTSPTAKSWPTSVFFFDKDKPFNKGIALRYVMVGMKQNHAFQLWDLGLGKAVQEINLPHEKESDAICSVAFHPKTGIMAVAHPTRNSIFFIHVSCPRYNLPPLSQAGYITRLAAKNDKSGAPLAPVNATAIMTSITEYSFASKGQIRSLHMLNESAGPTDVDDPDNAALLELYVMHSKGVCSIQVRRSDLGWKKEGEPIHPKEAVEEGVISLALLKPPQPIPDDSTSTGGDTSVPKSERSARESIKKESSNVSRQSMTPEAAMRASTLAKVESKQDAARAAIINGGEKSEKKKKKRAATDTASQASSAPRLPPPSYAQAAQAVTQVAPAKAPSPPASSAPEPVVAKPVEGEAPEWAKKLISQHFQQTTTPAANNAELDLKKVEDVVQAEISKTLSREFVALNKRLDDERRVFLATFESKQQAVLRVVSSTLSENLEKVLLKMIEDTVRTVLLPEVVQNTAATIEKTISNGLRSTLDGQLAKELPESVLRALKNPQTVQSLSDTVAKKVSGTLEPKLSASFGTIINPAISGLSNTVEHEIGHQLRQAQIQHRDDADKIAQLTDTVQILTETVQTMVANQSELQNQVMKLQQLLSQPHGREAPVSHASPRPLKSPVKQKTPEQVEAEAITRLMAEGNYEQGTMQWLQSPRSVELFDTVFVRCNPAYLNQVSALLALSTGAVVTETLEQHVPERLIWLEAVLASVDPNDPEIHDIVPRIMDVLNQRLTAAYIKLNETTPNPQMLRRISALVKKVNDLARAVANSS